MNRFRQYPPAYTKASASPAANPQRTGARVAENTAAQPGYGSAHDPTAHYASSPNTSLPTASMATNPSDTGLTDSPQQHHPEQHPPEQQSHSTHSQTGSSLGWLPEMPLMLSPSLACQLGVEEALLVTTLHECVKSFVPQAANGHHWYNLHAQQLASVAPFWQANDIQRLSLRLRELGIILIASASFVQSGQLKFAFRPKPSENAREQTAQNSGIAAQTGQARAPQEPAAAKVIAPHWQPSQETLLRLAQHGISKHFALEQVSQFVTYWRGVNEAKRNWDSAFFQNTIQQWRSFEAKQNHSPQQTPMTREWQPSEDAMEVLTLHAGISRSFVEDAIPEFVLYWREQGALCDNWNRRFRDHVNRQWAKYTSALEHDPTPRRINEGWAPSRDVYDILRLANIDGEFANRLVPEFVIYWRDSNQTHRSWNTKFLQYAKRRWAQREAEALRGHANNASTRDLSLDALVNDRSWAD